jgi:hypothetical protein
MISNLTEGQLDDERFRFQDHLDYILSDEEWMAICSLLKAWARRHEWGEHAAHMAFSLAMQEFIRLTLERNGTLYPHLDPGGGKIPMPAYWRDCYRHKKAE